MRSLSPSANVFFPPYPSAGILPASRFQSDSRKYRAVPPALSVTVLLVPSGRGRTFRAAHWAGARVPVPSRKKLVLPAMGQERTTARFTSFTDKRGGVGLKT